MPLKIEIEATEKLTSLDGVLCRVWEGKLPTGTPVHVFVHRIAVDESDKAGVAQLERELKEQMPPGHFFPLSQVL
jgi:hypothetical protein